jgi:hypothetical protein
MLADTRLVFDRLVVDRLATATLIEALKADEESPWVDDHKPLTPERLARHLRSFEIRSKQIKIAGTNVRGFLRESFVDSWDRYLSEPATPSQDPLPRYPDHAASSSVAGYSGGSGLVKGHDDDVVDLDGYGPSAFSDDPAPEAEPATPICSCGKPMRLVPDPTNRWMMTRFVCTNPNHGSTTATSEFSDPAWPPLPPDDIDPPSALDEVLG